MSEYQRYEWMTGDRPLTRAQLDAVKALSSHIDASSTHALVDYEWGNFKHDPLQVLHEFFDGFLYWANWGAPELALRFPHGILPEGLLDGYDLDEVVTVTPYPDYDLIDIHFGELEAPDEWVDYELGPLMALREELMDGDLRALYIVWLASQRLLGSADADDEEQENEDELYVPPVSPALGTLTSAQQALAELLQVPAEVLVAAAHHSNPAPAAKHEDVAARVTLLPAERRTEYLVRLARGEPGLSRRLLRELRELSQPGQGKRSAPLSRGERVTYAILLKESRAIRAGWEREKREQERLARERQLQQIHDHPDQYWHQADLAVMRGSGAGYDEAAHLLSELREVAERFQETGRFHERFRAWVQPHLRRPALVKRLQDRRFPLPDA
jgi:hypothetical protein